MSTLARRQRRSADIWPGFVDALTSLIMVMIFVLLIFAIGQFALSDTLAGKNQALDALNARVAELARNLSLSESDKRALDQRVAELSASLGSSRIRRVCSAMTSPPCRSSSVSSKPRPRACPANSTARNPIS